MTENDRLTHRRASGIKSGYWSAATKDTLIRQLAAYEDTGLLPDEVRAMQLAAARERMERGEWLNASGDFSDAECSKCGEFYDVTDGEDSEQAFNLFKECYSFCPACGAPMTDKAIDIIARRREGIYG